ncbi:MAG: DUF222 domain-containing protein [Nitriliruptorales bacterium]|nr:DUF222 domain-containing protein [Nitriliruptorales bacterium]
MLEHMYESELRSANRWRPGAGCRVARETRTPYTAAACRAAPQPKRAALAPSDTGPPETAPSDTAEPVTLATTVAMLASALDALAGVDLVAEGDRELLDSAMRLQQEANRLAGQQLRLLDAVDRRDAHVRDGAVTTASWLRGSTRQDHGQATHQAEAARRLRHLPRLRHALEAGTVTLAHVTAVTRAAVPRRIEAIAAVEPTLVELACAAQPRDVRRAVRHVRDAVDPDGSAAASLREGPDERRHLDLRYTFDGLWEIHGTLDTVQGELLATALDALETPDPADTPPLQRRAAGQRRADALAELARRCLDRGDAPMVQGNKPHLLLVADLQTLLGCDDLATRRPRLRFAGDIDPSLARRLAKDLDGKATAVLTMGPWRVVNVGRTHRTLPPWLRAVLEMVHVHCRGPDCDRPMVWTQAHHERAWGDDGETDLNATIPLCQAHHDLVTSARWGVAFDPDTGACAWTSPDGRTIRTHPPP